MSGDGVPPSGEQVELRHGRQSAVVVTGGGGIRAYAVGNHQLLDGYAVDEMCSGARGQLLIPWPNRIRDGRYSLDGDDRQLALTEPDKGNAIHGFVRWHTWTLAEHTDARAVLTHTLLAQSGYPCVLRLRVVYELGEEGLRVHVSATNAGASPAPYGTGAHPYLRAANGLIDSCTLRIPASTRLLTDGQQIPVGQEPVQGTDYDFREPRRISDLKLDTGFSDLIRDEDGRARVVLHDPQNGVSLTLWMDASHEYVMAFTGDTLSQRQRHGLGVEPMTCPPNAFASGDHLTVLRPGESHDAQWGISPAGLSL